jgi:hypothetical protein
MSQREFWTTKNPAPEYEALTFTHDDFTQPFRIVANKFEDVTLGGYLHQAVRMDITLPEVGNNKGGAMAIKFPRVVVGRTFSQQLRRITLAGRYKPITVQYARYQSPDLATPVQTLTLYVSGNDGVSLNADSVQVTATVDNPMRRSVARIYDVSVFTGLELL